jgi:hypothetical protein
VISRASRKFNLLASSSSILAIIACGNVEMATSSSRIFESGKPRLPIAAVIGCSHNYNGCNHVIHPTKDDFYTIDIDAQITPDLTHDITREDLPSELQGAFQLTILECLPYHCYNSDTIWQTIGFDGQKGLENIRKITAPDGFIMVVGNSQEFRFRSSLGNLKFIEIAQSDLDSKVILIPNNQLSNLEEINSQLENLPPVLKQSINAARENAYYSKLEPLAFCKLNYKPSARLSPIVEHLSCYITVRSNGDDYKSKISVLGNKFTFGFSRDEKIEAADALIQVLLGNKDVASLQPHYKALSQGRLGEMVSRYFSGPPNEAKVKQVLSSEGIQVDSQDTPSLRME